MKKVIIFIFGLLLIFAIILLSGMARKPDKITPTEPKGIKKLPEGLVLKITSYQKEFLLGEPIFVDIELLNTSSTTINVSPQIPLMKKGKHREL